MNMGRLFQISLPLNLIAKEYFLLFIRACSLWILNEDQVLWLWK